MKLSDLSRSSFHAMDPSKREEILSAAQKVFSEVGFKEATIRQICKEAKANVCLVSYYFGGKESLYKAIFEKVFHERVEKTRQFMEGIDSTLTADQYGEKLREFLGRIYDEIMGKPDFFKLMHRELMDGLPRAENVVKAFLKEVNDSFVRFLEFGQKKKFIRKDISPNLIAGNVINTFIGYASHQHMNRPDLFFPGVDPKNISAQVKNIVTKIFFEGVLT